MSPRGGKKPARKAARRPAKKQAAARKRSARPVRKAEKPAVKKAKTRAVKKAAAKKAAVKRRATTKRPAAKEPVPARRATLRLVSKPALKPARAAAPPPVKRSAAKRPFAGAIAGASAKDLALFDLVRARVEVEAAIQGMVAASANTPVAEGKWTPRQIVLHLHYWDREMLPYVERACRHDERPPHTMDRILDENAASQAEFATEDWEVARRLMQQSRESLLEELQSLPEEPAAMWSGEHALGWLIRILAHHDRHHAAAIKEARTRTGSPR